jgi:hypothetical protein
VCYSPFQSSSSLADFASSASLAEMTLFFSPP